MNLVMISGNLTRDPEMRYTPNGVAVTNFSVAINEGKNQDGSDKAIFLNVTVWGSKEKAGSAEACANNLKKGSKVLVKGRLQNRDWTDREGVKRRSTEIVADPYFGVEFMSPRAASQQQQATVADVDPDEIPF